MVRRRKPSWNVVVGTEVILSGIVHRMKYEIHAMLESGGGSIVNMVSILNPGHTRC
jgi:hypothetical protein